MLLTRYGHLVGGPSRHAQYSTQTIPSHIFHREELDLGRGGGVSHVNRSASSPNTARRTHNRCTAHGCG
jgi:hypothetical protein